MLPGIQQEAEERLRRGIQPVVIPTLDEIATAKTRVQYEQGRLHFAVAGVTGSGKSSLVNAIHGVENWNQDAAATGVVETIVTSGRYPDPNPDLPFVWYDIPGTGTLHQPDWLDGIAILTNCRRFHIPTYIIRSKADAHIHNIMYKDGLSFDTDAPVSTGEQTADGIPNEAFEALIDLLTFDGIEDPPPSTSTVPRARVTAEGATWATRPTPRIGHRAHYEHSPPPPHFYFL
ncbi:hypothetical protein EDD15DRAFT_2375254 [Pisolithus albus]|nr:hypothetical protein EDD15DRAFT_2375254 [Pisolithus albus]